MSDVEFYFDFSSPNAYFASVQLHRLAEDKTDVFVDWKPVFLGGIMNELDSTPPAMESELKADYLMTDLERWSNRYDIPFSFPEDFPLDSLPALRSFLVLEKNRSADPISFAQNVFQAAWVDGRDISQVDVLQDALPASSSDVPDLPEAISQQSIKDELKRRTDEAMERGVFGCPTFFVDDEMFWGKDRLDFVRRQLEVN